MKKKNKNRAVRKRTETISTLSQLWNIRVISALTRGSTVSTSNKNSIDNSQGSDIIRPSTFDLQYDHVVLAFSQLGADRLLPAHDLVQPVSADRPVDEFRLLNTEVNAVEQFNGEVGRGTEIDRQARQIAGAVGVNRREKDLGIVLIADWCRGLLEFQCQVCRQTSI